MQPDKLHIKPTKLSKAARLLQSVPSPQKIEQQHQTLDYTRSQALQNVVAEAYGVGAYSTWKSWLHPSGRSYVLDERKGEYEHTDVMDKIGYPVFGDSWDSREKALNDGWMRVNYYKVPSRGMELSIEYRRGPVGDIHIVPVIREFVKRMGALPTSILWENGRGGHKFYNSMEELGRPQPQYKSRLAQFR